MRTDTASVIFRSEHWNVGTLVVCMPTITINSSQEWVTLFKRMIATIRHQTVLRSSRSAHSSMILLASRMHIANTTGASTNTIKRYFVLIENLPNVRAVKTIIIIAPPSIPLTVKGL